MDGNTRQRLMDASDSLFVRIHFALAVLLLSGCVENAEKRKELPPPSPHHCTDAPILYPITVAYLELPGTFETANLPLHPWHQEEATLTSEEILLNRLGLTLYRVDRAESLIFRKRLRELSSETLEKFKTFPSLTRPIRWMPFAIRSGETDPPEIDLRVHRYTFPFLDASMTFTRNHLGGLLDPDTTTSPEPENTISLIATPETYFVLVPSKTALGELGERLKQSSEGTFAILVFSFERPIDSNSLAP